MSKANKNGTTKSSKSKPHRRNHHRDDRPPEWFLMGEEFVRAATACERRRDELDTAMAPALLEEIELGRALANNNR
jgi:hypothetical protein